MTDLGPFVFIERPGRNFRVPKHFKRFALSVVGNAGEANGFEVAEIAVGTFDQPFPAAQLNKTADFRHFKFRTLYQRRKASRLEQDSDRTVGRKAKPPDE
ncbi:hypothetical protein K9U33_18410 [Rhodoblastus acidophilus]|uniref:Uncharacterized protein n=1 Tax=Candidatus Rhodoblastus alkanivorans TaxID=2954117 RepID=A0ABS9Z544_9HYPH|nr:hypothetical protein [Candidatus Rhodoblastus alkanivorans]MCI4680597.1 hypothetical protein [Candidatus Rhodoblastus alkanivorans]MCI4681757.1 hypothetical protein [Candidatus Rhodoblastus alkanivorans]